MFFALIAAVLLAGCLLTLTRAGKKDGICDYSHAGEEGERHDG